MFGGPHLSEVIAGFAITKIQCYLIIHSLLPPCNNYQGIDQNGHYQSCSGNISLS